MPSKRQRHETRYNLRFFIPRNKSHARLESARGICAESVHKSPLSMTFIFQCGGWRCDEGFCVRLPSRTRDPFRSSDERIAAPGNRRSSSNSIRKTHRAYSMPERDAMLNPPTSVLLRAWRLPSTGRVYCRNAYCLIFI